MGQEVKIPVSANTAPAEKAADELRDAFAGVAEAVASIGGASQTANRGLSDLLRRARDTRAMLSRELRTSVSGGDAVTFMRNFAGMQPRSNSLRGFNNEQDWYRGHHLLFTSEARAAEHRRRVFAYGMQGTSYSAGGMPNLQPPPAPPGGGGGGGGGFGGAFASGVGRTRSAAFGFGRSMLALAGIGSIIGMAGRGRDLATEEEVGADTLKRRMGDLGISFDHLRDQARSAAVGLGITYVESQRLAGAMQREIGNPGRGGFAYRLRNAEGFSRAYGVDPAEGVQFFGQMARFGGARDDAGQRRLALLIGDAISKSGFTARVEDILQAVADYTAMNARATLSATNTGAYANALTSLAASGRPGLDPASAAALLGTADAAMRRGGAMGDASLNFFYAAMRNASPGIKPVDALALMEGGLFGTTAGTFGPGSPLAGMMGKGVALNDVTNFDKVVPMFRRFYGNNGYMLDAVKNAFGLSSHAQAAALVGLSDKGQLGASSTLLHMAGVDPMALNATGFATIGAIANAPHGGLQSVYADIMGRSDLTAAQKQKFAQAVGTAMRSGDDNQIRTAMAQAVSGLYQEKTPGSETRQAITDLNDELTKVGGALLQVLNPIRDAVVALADHFAPGYVDSSGTRPIGAAPWAGGNQGIGKAGSAQRSAMEQAGMRYFMSQGWSKNQAAAIVGAGGVAESNLDPLALGDGGKARGIFQWHRDRWAGFVAWAKQRGLDVNDPMAQFQYAQFELTHGSETSAGIMLKNAGTPEQAAAAMVQFERPRGYISGLGNYRDADNWVGRLGQTQRLASMTAPEQAAAAQGGQTVAVHGSADVHLHLPGGKALKFNVPLRSVGAPQPAGTSNPFLADPDVDPFQSRVPALR